MTIDPRLTRIVAAQPYPLLFATISRRRADALAGQGGAHVLLTPERLLLPSLRANQETIGRLRREL